jgi:dihydroxy-acid dehydratase
MGVELDLEDFDSLSANIPLLANLQPSGEYFMEDFYYAGGLPAVMKELHERLHHQALAVSGKPIEHNYKNAECYDASVIGTLDKPFKPETGLVVLKGNLCENGSVLKPSAATAVLMQHKGKAVVFESIEDYHARIDDPELPVTKDSILVLKNVGPVGYPGMPEVGNMSVPKKLLEQGVQDMVRISDGRMSGTGFGTVVLHVSPESAVGGTLALVQNGDWIELDVAGRRLTLLVEEQELEERRQRWTPTHRLASRGYVHLYQQHVLQAHLGVDMDFCVGGSGSEVTRDSH